MKIFLHIKINLNLSIEIMLFIHYINTKLENKFFNYFNPYIIKYWVFRGEIGMQRARVLIFK